MSSSESLSSDGNDLPKSRDESLHTSYRDRRAVKLAQENYTSGLKPITHIALNDRYYQTSSISSHDYHENITSNFWTPTQFGKQNIFS